jgi:predicted nucleic acid-binding protein
MWNRPVERDRFMQLGRGESDAISLALEHPISTLLLDDRAARKIATALGLPLIGTVGILEKAAEMGLIDLGDAFERLKATDFRFPPHVLDQIVAEFVEKSRHAE